MVVKERRSESLYRDYYGHLMHYAARRVEGGQEAGVVGETFTTAWQHLDQLRDEIALPGLYGIARRVMAGPGSGPGPRPRAGPAPAPAPAPAQQGVPRRHSCHSGFASSKIHCPAAFAVEIGRASCRERV